GEAATEEGDYAPFEAFEPAGGSSTPEAPIYRDRIIAPDRLEPLPPDGDDEATLAGPPRAFHVEAIAQQTRFAGEKSTEFGTGFGGFWDSGDWGTISAEAVVFSSDREREGERRLRGTGTLWQRGLAMPGGWLVANGLGVLNTPMPALIRDQYRFILPSVPMLGATTEWQRPDRGLTLQAGIGRGGSFDGALLNGFTSGDGSVFTGAAQWRWAPGLDGAIDLLFTDGRIVPDDQGLPEFQNGRVRALVSGNRWSGARDSVQLNLLASDDGERNAVGGWLDARSQRGSVAHRYGVFHLPPGLAWGAWPINNDVRGGYYGFDFSRARWSWNASIDRIDSISGSGFDGWFGSSFLRYQASPRLGYGGSLSARRSGRDGSVDRAEALQVFVDRAWGLGQTRLQYDRAQSRFAPESWQVQVDPALRLREGARLSVTAGWGELAEDGADPAPTIALGAYGGFDLTDTFSLDGGVRWRRGDGDTDDATRSTDINLGWRWQLASRWLLSGYVIESRGERRSPFILDPITNVPAFDTLPNDRSVFVTLRYDFSAGRSRGVLGGPPNAATGNVVGTIFLDETRDGVRGANEALAANITVVLDGRFTARTDAQGRFRFERVAVGTHAIEVVSDNLPLAWIVDEDQARRDVLVDVRRDAVIEIGAVRQR
ncbi:MAG: carboxypeptidase-like regulatory domain-containing protein, partial [Silanimonas sp.]